jgi:hypothetical protein
LYRLVKPFRVVIRVDGGTFKIVVPEGFVTDFASIPRWLWWLWPPDGPWRRAAVVHDWLYSRVGSSRFLADAMFRELIPDDEVGYWTRIAMFYSVRAFGGWARKRGPAVCCGDS